MQYKSLSLGRHIRMGWSVVADELGEFIEILSPQKRVGEHWYLGTADAVYQNLYSIVREDPRHLLVLSGDHVYKMDYARMMAFHRERGAAATIGVIEIPSEEASRFGVLQVDSDDRLVGFLEKPKDLAARRPGPGVDGHLHLRHEAPGAAARSRRAPLDQPRLRQGHHPRAHRQGAGLRLPLHRREQEGVEVLARHRHARRVLRRQHGSLPGQPGFQPVRSGVAAADASGRRRRPRSSSSPTKGGAAARRSTRSSRPAASSRAAGSRAACSVRTCACTASATSNRAS